MLRIAVADDAPAWLKAIRLVLDEIDATVTATASSGEDLLLKIAGSPPDIVILDALMPKNDWYGGIRVAREARARFPAVGILLLSAHAITQYAADMLSIDGGGIGFLLKDEIGDVSRFESDLRRIAAGGVVIEPEISQEYTRRKHIVESLTSTEIRVLDLVAQGLTNAAIADEMAMAPKTIERYVSKIFDTLELGGDPHSNKRVRAAILWLRNSAVRDVRGTEVDGLT